MRTAPNNARKGKRHSKQRRRRNDTNETHNSMSSRRAHRGLLLVVWRNSDLHESGWTAREQSQPTSVVDVYCLLGCLCARVDRVAAAVVKSNEGFTFREDPGA